MAVIAAEEHGAQPGDRWLLPGTREPGHLLRGVTGPDQRQVGHANAGWPGPNLLGDRTPRLALGQRLVVGYVVGLSDGAIAVECQQQPLHDVGHIDERQGVVAGANRDPRPRANPVGDAPEVQPVARAEERTWPD